MNCKKTKLFVKMKINAKKRNKLVSCDYQSNVRINDDQKFSFNITV